MMNPSAAVALIRGGVSGELIEGVAQQWVVLYMKSFNNN